jgi:hypothetical protein
MHVIVAVAAGLMVAGCDAPMSSEVDAAGASMAKSDNAPLVQVSGGGTVDIPSGRSKYGFHASQNGAGEVKGVFDLHFTTSDSDMHGEITCLSVTGNVARLNGVVTRTSDEVGFPVGTVLHWQVIDNGEGSAAAPDAISFFFTVPSPTFCDYVALPPHEWTNGNVQIKY